MFLFTNNFTKTCPLLSSKRNPEVSHVRKETPKSEFLPTIFLGFSDGFLPSFPRIRLTLPSRNALCGSWRWWSVASPSRPSFGPWGGDGGETNGMEVKGWWRQGDWMDDFYGNMMREYEREKYTYVYTVYVYIYNYIYLFILWIVLLYYNIYIYIVIHNS